MSIDMCTSKKKKNLIFFIIELLTEFNILFITQFLVLMYSPSPNSVLELVIIIQYLNDISAI